MSSALVQTLFSGPAQPGRPCPPPRGDLSNFPNGRHRAPRADSDPASRLKVDGLAAEFPENWFRMLPTSGPNVCSAHSREGPPERLKSHTSLAIRPQPQAAKPLPAGNSQGQVVGEQGIAKGWGVPEPLPGPQAAALAPPGGWLWNCTS